MPAVRADITIDQGSTFSTTLNLTDENGEILSLVGYSAASQLRKHHTSTNAVSFTCAVNTEVGSLSLSLTPVQTANVVAGRYVYDVELTSGAGVVSRIVEGVATVTPQVTR
jgi:hypothetical protein